MQLYRYFVGKPSEFCRHTLCVASQLVFIVVYFVISPETFVYILV
jgi:hypothetical protein